MLWPVFYWEWQFGCCGEPFAVGERVEWPLVVSFHREPWLPQSCLVEADLRPEVVDGTAAVRMGRLVAYAPDATGPWKDRRVIFYEDHHGEVPQGFPATPGLVRRIRVVSAMYRFETPHDERLLTPVAGSTQLRDVASATAAFGTGSGPKYRPGLESRREIGLLVDLDCGASNAA